MNPKILEIPGSLIRQVNAKKKPSSIDLGLGEPSLSPNLAHLEYAMRYVAEHGMRYTPNAGDPNLRAAIAAHYAYPELHRAENVCVTIGSQEAMYVTLKTLLDPGQDELLIIEPTFPSYAKMAALENISVCGAVMSESDDFAFDAERILAGITERTRAIVLCSPCNPTARVLTQDQARILVTGLERRSTRENPIWLIQDEIYREQMFVDKPANLADMYPHTIVTNSLSKSNALTGLRLGWILAPAQFIEQAIKCHAWVTSCADTFGQAVALHIFESALVGEQREWYRVQREGAFEELASSGLQFLPIDGSFYACIQLPEGFSSADVAFALIEQADVVTIPGVAFGSSFDRWLRLSWVTDLDRFREGIRRITDYIG